MNVYQRSKYRFPVSGVLKKVLCFMVCEKKKKRIWWLGNWQTLIKKKLKFGDAVKNQKRNSETKEKQNKTISWKISQKQQNILWNSSQKASKSVVKIYWKIFQN